MNNARGEKKCQRCRQSGAAAIEFAFLFPLLLLILYSTVVYSYVFFLQQTINLIAQESAKAAVALAPAVAPDGTLIPPDYAVAVTAYYNASLNNGLLSGLTAAQQADIPVPIVSAPQNITIVDGNGQNVVIGQTITVTVVFNGLTGIFPSIGLPGIGASLPPLPATLQAHASVRVS